MNTVIANTIIAITISNVDIYTANSILLLSNTLYYPKNISFYLIDTHGLLSAEYGHEYIIVF